MAKITKEQLDLVVSQQSELSKVLSDIGALEANKHSLLHKIADINKAIKETKAELEKEYGSVNIDLETGEYTVIETEAESDLSVVKSEN
jgi:predicted  nucleic acid-binding Zn-ribbon protein